MRKAIVIGFILWAYIWINQKQPKDSDYWIESPVYPINKIDSLDVKPDSYYLIKPTHKNKTWKPNWVDVQ